MNVPENDIIPLLAAYSRYSAHHWKTFCSLRAVAEEAYANPELSLPLILADIYIDEVASYTTIAADPTHYGALRTGNTSTLVKLTRFALQAKHSEVLLRKALNACTDAHFQPPPSKLVANGHVSERTCTDVFNSMFQKG